MLGTIKNIQAVEDIFINTVLNTESKNKIDRDFTSDGYFIKTDEHDFYVLIENDQNCCERWGYMTSEDDLQYFVGSMLLEIRTTDTELNQKIVTELKTFEDEDDTPNTQFVDFVTPQGVLQLAVYNAHNGYYGHKIAIVQDGNLLVHDIL